MDTDAAVCLAYRVSGPDGAPPLVLLHGLGDRGASWAPVLDALAGTQLSQDVGWLAGT